MDPIHEGATGVAVEDIQERLGSLGYTIDEAERAESLFGQSTANSVARFRFDHDLPLGTAVDTATWSALVDEGYNLGDRTLYLRLPNFHGHDVRTLQHRLNILGFSCGVEDGYYGVHTEAAVKQFQENVGVMADGMAFQDTIDAIDRLHHVWNGKPADGPHPMGGMGFARAASVLDELELALTGEDPISRNVAARVANLAGATNEQAGIALVDSPQDSEVAGRTCLVLSCSPMPKGSKISNVMVDDSDTLPKRIRTACEGSRSRQPLVRLELAIAQGRDEAFTVSDAQMIAVRLLDAICAAFAD